ncbi:ornithine carbamoyltransferase [bacterium]|nr:ornithine carbamoyltransferase [bacterium]
MTTHFLSLADFTREELTRLLDDAARMKKTRRDGQAPLAGRTLGMIFEKASTRTRVSFEVGMYELGGHALFLASENIQLGRGEPIRDTARVLSRMVDGVMIRTFAQERLAEFAAYASVPVINGLSDLLHPCQVLADVFTMREAFREIGGHAVAWIGDGNNMANSWINAASVLGFTLRLACPEGYEPDARVLAAAKTRGADVSIVRDPREAAAGAHVVTTDVWASMGQEDEAKARATAFAGYCVDENLMALADPGAIFLHCLPAHRGEEVSEAVFEGPRSRVWDEAENRLHVQKAVLAALMAGE